MGDQPTAPFVVDARRKRRPGTAPRRGFNPFQPRGPNGRWVDTGARLKSALPLAEARTPFDLDLGPVLKGAAASKAAGMNLRGFRHSISDQAMRHIRGRHPDMTGDDFARLPALLRQGTPVLSSESGVNGVPRLIYDGTVDRTRYRYVTEVRRRKAHLAAITFFKV